MAVGQLFSQRFGYAAHALAYMAKKRFGEVTTLPELATWMQSIWPSASRTYLSAVLQQLVRAGLVRSHRGVAGGYSLARPPEQTSLREIYTALEGVQLDRCGLSLEPECPRQNICRLSLRIRTIEHDFLKLLERHTLDRLARDLTVTGNGTHKPARRKTKSRSSAGSSRSK